jgi:disulfide bond formation protein DsbB
MNLTTIHYLNVFLGAGAIILQILAVIVLFTLFFGPKKSIFLDFIEKHFLTIGFLVSIFASLFSLVYSEVIGFIPCQLCWFQRVFMFPQVFIFGVALWGNFRNQFSEAKNVIKYSIPLLCVGFVISVYQNFIYYFSSASSASCSSSGVSCFEHLVSEFGGYISIPMLSLTSFFALLAITLVVHFYRKDQ